MGGMESEDMLKAMDTMVREEKQRMLAYAVNDARIEMLKCTVGVSDLV